MILWWLIPIVLIPFWLLQNATHEYSHASVLWWYKWNVQVIPLPHRTYKRDPAGKVLVYYPWQKRFWTADTDLKMSACYGIRTNEAEELPDPARSVMLGTPWLISYGLTLLATTCALGAQQPWLITIFLIWATCNCIDMCFNRWSLFKKDNINSTDWHNYNNDWWKITKLEGVSLWKARLSAIGNTSPTLLFLVLVIILKLLNLG